MEVKTLKELGFDESGKGDIIITHEELKKEGKKWINHFIKERLIPLHNQVIKTHEPEFQWELWYYYCKYCEGKDAGEQPRYSKWNGAIHFIKNFFNITDDEMEV